MFCQKCGSMLNDNLQFCTTCGARIQPQQTATPPTQFSKENSQYNNQNSQFNNQNSQFNNQPPVNPNYINQETQPPKKKGGGALVIGLIVGVIVVIVVAVLIGVAAFFIGQKTGKETNAPEITTTQQTEEETTAERFTTDPNGQIITDPNVFELVYPDFYYETEIYYVEPSEGINLRYGPGTNYDRIIGIPKGKEIEIVGGSNSDPDRNWVYIYYEEKSTYGWVSTDYISFNYVPADPGTVSPFSVHYYSENEIYSAYVTPSVGLNVRSGPGTDYNKTGSMRQGEIFTVIGISNYDSNWVYINYEGISYGYVHKDYISVY